MRLRIHVDGGSRGNPGPAAIGIVIHDADDATPLHEAGYFLGRATNNVAEYTALIRALEIARALQPQAIEIFSDSELMVRQVRGEYRVKSPDLQPLHKQALDLLDGFDAWTIQHVRRHLNARADELVNLCLDAQRDIIAESSAGFATPPSPSPTAAPPRKPRRASRQVRCPHCGQSFPLDE